MSKSKSAETQYVVFKLGAETFGLAINEVKEIIVYQETTKIPGSSPFVDGIINLRGQVIPVFNLRRKFGLQQVERTRGTRIVVIEANENVVGIVVDNVSEVIMIPGTKLDKPSSMIASGVSEDYIEGIAKLDERLIIILCLQNVIEVNTAKAV